MNKEREKKYAPIMIVTLNRCEHLKRCINSLANNIGANFTEIYISVDFPPAEKYKVGHKEVVDYLNDTKDLDAFKAAYVYYQEKNLGPSDNIYFLMGIIRENHDCYIFSEDDNEFSPNFLEYINKGLKKFECDKNIVSINGMKDADWYVRNNNVTGSKLFPGYGYGTWFKKEDVFRAELQNALKNPIYWHPKKAWELYKKNKYIFALYINGVVCSDNGLFWDKSNNISDCDTTRAIYMYFSDYFCVVPMITKSRNWGNDGSGTNMPNNTKIDPRMRWVLDDKRSFEYKKNTVEYYIENDNIAERFLIDTLGRSLIYRSIIEYFLLCIFGFDRKKVIRLKKRIKWLI